MSADSEPRASSSGPRWSGTQRIGRYDVVRRLALGGMAELFLCRVGDVPGFEKLVVVKRILPHLATDLDLVAMFRREARIAASLEHPNIVHVSDLGNDGRDYIVMPYLVGKDLLSITRELDRREETMPIGHAIAIGIAMAAGLDYAHHHCDNRGQPLGIVHRDVSPSNIFITYGGEITLLDFGIARASSEARITRPGTRKGKTRYNSPEQIQDLPLDGRSDVFSLGIVLYELTTGTRLFDADNDAAAIEMIMRRPIPLPSQWVPGYPRELERIVMRALAQNREQRYATARQLREALEVFAHDHRVRASPIAAGEYVANLFGEPVQPVVDESAIPPPPTGAFESPVIRISGDMPALVVREPVLGARAPTSRQTSSHARVARPWSDLSAIAIIVVASITAVATALTWWLRQ